MAWAAYATFKIYPPPRSWCEMCWGGWMAFLKWMPVSCPAPSLFTLISHVCLPPQILDVRNVVVVVSRWYGGILLGPDRFKHINNCARNILVEEGYAASMVRRLPGLLWITLSSPTDTSSVRFYQLSLFQCQKTPGVLYLTVRLSY